MNADPTAIFVEEANDLLSQLESALLKLEQTPWDEELIGVAFRALHTIKGSGAMFGFDAVAAFTHHLESAFERVRKGERTATSDLIGLTLAAKDHVRDLIARPDAADPAVGAAVLRRLAAVLDEEVDDDPARDVPVADAAHADATWNDTADDRRATWEIRFRPPANALSRGLNPLLMLDELRGLGHCTVTPLVEHIPDLEELDPADCHLGWEVVLTSTASRSAIDEVFMFMDDAAELSVERLDDESDRLGEILVRKGAVSEDTVRTALAEQTHLREEMPSRAAAAAAIATPSAGSVRVPAERLDDLVDQVGELVIAQSRLKQLIAEVDDPRVKSVAEDIERLSNGLRDTTMGIRTVPIGSLFDRFRRLTRDLSKELGKDIVLTMSGEETELDKTVVERLNDPLVHIIRNSIDHGIEDAAARTVAGKPPGGQLHLSAVHAGAQVRVTVRDDGRGLDLARIRAKAEENGLIQPDARLSPQETEQLIFHPGFSTARAITSVSGRGVGMDVVKRAVEALRGDIEVASAPGEGTAITLVLPLTLAIIDGLLVRVGTGRYVIPLSAVEECVELPAAEDARRGGRSFLNIRGDLVPFLRLRELFRAPTPPDEHQKVVIVATGDHRRVGLVVDQIIGDHQTVIKSLSKLHTKLESFSGATILGDGSVALILNVGHLIASGPAVPAPGEAYRHAS
jgi:two-component system chemotaxis sensor kinase CheA